jgi:hypothetical protein
MKTNKTFATAIVGALLLIGVSSAQAVFVPVGLQPGDSYHLLFVTRDSRNASAAFITSYNNFVQEQAELNPSLTGTDQGITYNAVASALRLDADDILVGVSARDNALVEAPVYLTDGTLIADGFDDLWNTANIDNKLLPAPINVTQFGVVDTTSSLTVATGTNFDGTYSNDPLGNIDLINEESKLGNGLVQGPQWIDDVSGPNGPLIDYRFYAMSEKITVPAVVPIPAAVWLFGSGLLGLVGVARRRKTS